MKRTAKSKANSKSKSRPQKNQLASMSEQPIVAIVMGSDSDLSYMTQAAEALSKFDIPFEMKIISAHRTPDLVMAFAGSARSNGIRVIIAGAGGAAHLPGMMAAHTTIPVIGVPIPNGPLQGQDALLSIVQMPKGVPVSTMTIGGAWNAGITAAQILSLGQGTENQRVARELEQYKEEMEQAVAKANRALRGLN
jgi:5-(carboxyamino)imidazole ribonucleotide mutase